MEAMNIHTTKTQAADPQATRRLEHALEVFAEYDVDRILAYKNAGDPARVAVERFGDSLAIRFSEVGYFNRVYHVDSRTLAHLDKLATFYRLVEQPVQFIAAAGTDLGRHSEILGRYRFAPGPSYARVSMDLSELSTTQQELPPGVEILTPAREDRETVLEVYLRGFGADEANIAAAKNNMRRLFELPQLHFWLGLVDGVPAGIGMLYTSRDQAFLCGGTTLPAYVQRGCHTALIRHRLEQARNLGSTRAISWAYENSESHKNMCAQGMATIAVDRAWDRPWIS